MSIATSPAEDWITVPKAERILGAGRWAVDKLVESGRLTRRSVPGSVPKLRLSEVEALAREFTSPAQASA